MSITTDIDGIQNQFRRLHAEGDHDAIIALLSPLLERGDLHPEHEGWALWNLCDRLAILRQGHEQLGYQKRFSAFSEKALSPVYTHWPVSDGTQAMTLTSAGYGADWLRWYDRANRAANRSEANRGVRFESHRALAYCFTHFGESNPVLASLDALKALLGEDPTWTNQDFAACTYHTLRLDYLDLVGDRDGFTAVRDELERHIAGWVARFEASENETAHPDPILGSWEQLNQTRPPSSVVTALGNAGCALCRTGQYELCLHFLDQAVRLGFRRNAYSNTLYVVALWKTTQDRVSVDTELATDPRLAADHLRRHAPELADSLLLGQG